MDLLKDITRELRGGDESARGDGQSGRAAAVRADSASEASESTVTGDDSATDASSGDDSPNSNRDGDLSRDDTHVCSFCETEFDADRRACPDCDAEIVLRGEL